MKKYPLILAFLSASVLLVSCEEDEGKLPNISFKSGGSYLNHDDSLTAKSSFIIGIDASKSESEDVLKKFNITKRINDSTTVDIFTKDLSGSEGNNFNYDYSGITDSISGTKTSYTFTVTNRDGLTNKVSINLTTR